MALCRSGSAMATRPVCGNDVLLAADGAFGTCPEDPAEAVARAVRAGVPARKVLSELQSRGFVPGENAMRRFDRLCEIRDRLAVIAEQALARAAAMDRPGADTGGLAMAALLDIIAKSSMDH